jgi:predicted NUDIX family NTP pyrophosphohydrolase
MVKRSAGFLIFRQAGQGEFEVLLVHPGGPFWARKDEGAWSIPKGMIEDGEDELTAARREVFEELGKPIDGPYFPLGEFRQPGGKRVTAFAMEAAFDVASLVSNTFEMEWPPKSGTLRTFPEVDRAGWFTLDEAAAKILKGQSPILDAFAGHGANANMLQQRRFV